MPPLLFDKKIFLAEAVGTFGLVVAATGSIVYDGIHRQALGLEFIALMHMAGLWFLVFALGRYSMAHFNPAVTLGFAITGHARWGMVPAYLAAQAAGAIAGSLFVLHVMGDHAELGLNRPDPAYGAAELLGIEAAATAILMGAILCIINTRAGAAVAGLVVGGAVAVDVWFFGPVSGASMNPVRSLAPAAVTGIFDDLWLYLVAPLAGVLPPALIHRRIFGRGGRH